MKEIDVGARRFVELSNSQRWLEWLGNTRQCLPKIPRPPVEGMLTRKVGLTLEAVGCEAAIGARCDIITPGVAPIDSEVVGFAGDKLFLMPTTDIQGLNPNARVIPSEQVYRVPVGEQLLGRVLDGSGKPLDGKGRLNLSDSVVLQGTHLNPLQRRPIRDTLDVGVRAINALTSVGRGQRLGLFAGSGVGKSVLLGMMTRYTSADVVVVGLIGERGREVQEFVQDILGDAGLTRAVVVAAPADTSPLNRLHGAMLCHSIAEYFRDQGRDVLLLMDSLTRFAQAQREIGLAIGELPATKGYPPSVFARLPQLVERTGNNTSDSGSITAFYTVLVEGDDTSDPIADASRAILDGHIVLSRQMAEAGLFPAIDVEASISRAMNSIVDPRHLGLVHQFRRLHASYESNRDLINIGAYQSGSDPDIDRAIAIRSGILDFLVQDMHTAVSSADSQSQLAALIEGAQLPANTSTGAVAVNNASA